MSDSPNKPQPPPTPGRGPAIWDLVIKELPSVIGTCDERVLLAMLDDAAERDRLGRRKYGQRLHAHDGRTNLIDAYQEALDLVVYLRKEVEELGPQINGPWVSMEEARLALARSETLAMCKTAARIAFDLRAKLLSRRGY